MEENECCLCEETLVGDKRKRRRFYGSSCENFKNYLQKLSPVPLSEVIQERDAYLCKSCESQLKKAVDLEEKLSKLHEKLKLKLTTSADSSQLHSLASKKRRTEEPEVSLKLQCMESSLYTEDLEVNHVLFIIIWQMKIMIVLAAISASHFIYVYCNLFSIPQNPFCFPKEVHQ